MTITITSHPTGLFTRHRKRVETFTDEGGCFDGAMNYIALLIASGHDFTVRVDTSGRKTIDETLNEIAWSGVLSTP